MTAEACPALHAGMLILRLTRSITEAGTHRPAPSCCFDEGFAGCFKRSTAREGPSAPAAFALNPNGRHEEC